MEVKGKNVYRFSLLIRILLSVVVIYLVGTHTLSEGEVSWFLVILGAIVVFFIWYNHVEVNDHVLSIQLGLRQIVLAWDEIETVDVFKSWLYLGKSCKITYHVRGRSRKYVFGYLDKMDRFTQELVERFQKAKSKGSA